MIEKHWKTEPLAEQLGISADTLRRAAHRGELCPVVLGRDFLWSEPDVLAWLEAQKMKVRAA